MIGRDPMEAAKAIVEDRLYREYNARLSAVKINVRRTLPGKEPDILNLATVINLIVADCDTPEMRADVERSLRQGAISHTRHASYQVVESQVDPEWKPEASKVSP